MARTTYSLAFTAASLRPELARIIAEIYLVSGTWEAAKDRILKTNALQCRSANSAIRLERELRQRLQTLSQDQITLLAQATAEDRAAIAWLSACKHIPFAFEFAAELLRDKLVSHDPILRLSDYETYVETKALSHPELSRLAPSSRSKIKRVLLRMLSEAGLLASGEGIGTIQRPVLSPVVVDAVRYDDPMWLAGFLVPEEEVANR